ncbi:hypothetical protein QR680_012643 [Steinernema hermaphroditum]|uniref:Uncharacterized protein n=1 Tax=Steinernema hermaphroditum TaxID=289476 RepID=A0AA39I4P7_9BILA|nr:hypothetical protein QR680_012643 [Steinernema hermaphroditum]
MAGTCAVPILWLPSYTPLASAVVVVFLCILGTAIAYARRELLRKKTFYGVEDKMDDEENAGEIIGHYDDEVKIVQSAEKSGREASLVGTPTHRGEVKVMIKRRPISKLTTRLSGETITPQVVSPAGIPQFHAIIDVDRTGRGFEVVDCLTRTVADLLLNARKPLSPDLEAKIAETILSETRFTLEAMTAGYWIVHARVGTGHWKVSGHENFGLNVSEMHLRLRFNVHEPLPMLLVAFRIDVVATPHTPAAVTPSRPKKRSASLLTASTPLTNTKTSAVQQSSVTGLSNVSQLGVNQIRTPDRAIHTQHTQATIKTSADWSKGKTAKSGRPVAPSTPHTPCRRPKTPTLLGAKQALTPQTTIPKSSTPVPVARTPRPQSPVHPAGFRSPVCISDTQASQPL